MPTIKAGRWCLVIIPGDHEPRHVHARLGTGRALEAIVLLERNGTVSLREARGLTSSELREVMIVVRALFDRLTSLWELYC
jgi:hypothetical protein